MAEPELSVLEGQCLDRHIPDTKKLEREVKAYEERRNAERATIDWRFTSPNAREKLKKLYPSICFETTTRDTGHYALSFLSGLLRMTTERNFSNIARMVGESPQNVQHFMTNSPWSAQEVLQQIREEVAQESAFAS